MNDLFTLVFSYGEIKHLIYVIGACFLCFLLMYGWGYLWNRSWSSSHDGLLVIASLFAIVPSLFVIRSQVSERILRTGPRSFEQHISRPLNSEMFRIFDKSAKLSNTMADFREKSIPCYANALVKKHPYRYLSFNTELPVDFIVSDKALKQLDECYRNRNTSEGLNAPDWDVIHAEGVRYLCQVQYEQNKAKLCAYGEFSTLPLYVLVLVILMIVIARLAYMDIDRKYCYPY